MAKTILVMAAIVGPMVAALASGPVASARSSAGIADTRVVALCSDALVRIADTRHPVKTLSSPGKLNTAASLGLSIVIR